LPFPLGVALEQREAFLLMRDGFPLQDPPPDLVDLALGVAQIQVDRRQQRRRDRSHVQDETALAHAHQQVLGVRQIVAVGLVHRLLLGGPLVRVLGGRVLETLDLAIQLFYLTQVVGALAPSGDAEVC
jgi:hypothetical protein